MKVLVTGGAGFIGANLCRRLLSEETVSEVVVLDDLSTGLEDNISDLPVVFHRSSLLQVDRLQQAAEGCDAIVHLAALGSVPRSISQPLATHEANATGTLNVLEAARTAGGVHVVLASSSSVYGANRTLPKSEDMMCAPMSPYAVTKLATEQYAMAFARCYGLPVLPFRFFNVFGPRQMPGHAYAAVIPVFLEAAMRGAPLPLNGDGMQSRDFTFVDTVTEVLTRAVREKVTGGPTNLAFGTRNNLNTVIELIGDVLGTEPRVEHRPERPGDVRHSQADNSQLRSLFPDIQPHSLVDGIRRTAEWMRTLPAFQ